MSASVLPAVASVHLHSLKPNSFGVADDLHEMELSRVAVGAALRRAVGIVGLSDKEAAALQNRRRAVEWRRANRGAVVTAVNRG